MYLLINSGLAADHDASEAGEEEDKENKAEAVEVYNLDAFLQKTLRGILFGAYSWNLLLVVFLNCLAGQRATTCFILRADTCRGLTFELLTLLAWLEFTL